MTELENKVNAIEDREILSVIISSMLVSEGNRRDFEITLDGADMDYQAPSDLGSALYSDYQYGAMFIKYMYRFQSINQFRSTALKLLKRSRDGLEDAIDTVDAATSTVTIARKHNLVKEEFDTDRIEFMKAWLEG